MIKIANPKRQLTMASTFKIPIAVQLLTRIDVGEVKLDQMIEIKQSDLHPGSGTLVIRKGYPFLGSLCFERRESVSLWPA